MAMVGHGAVVDDTTLLRPTATDLQKALPGISAAIKKVNGRLNTAKTDYIAYKPTREGPVVSREPIVLEGKTVRPASRNGYVKLIGGNVNILAHPQKDLQEVRRHTARLFPKLKAHPPGVTLLRIILDGCVTMRWVFRKIVDWPQDLLVGGGAKGGNSTSNRGAGQAGEVCTRPADKSSMDIPFWGSGRGGAGDTVACRKGLVQGGRGTTAGRSLPPQGDATDHAPADTGSMVGSTDARVHPRKTLRLRSVCAMGADRGVGYDCFYRRGGWVVNHPPPLRNSVRHSSGSR